MSEDSVEPFEEAIEVEEPPMPVDEQPEETVDGLPVLAEVRPIEPAAPAALPAVQAAAAAATGFVAGAATVALVRRRGLRKLARAQGAGGLAARGAGERFPVTGARTFLVHVHVIGRSSD